MPPRPRAADAPPEPTDADPAATPTTTEGSDERQTVRLALNSWPVDRFDHGVDGAPVLTADGVDVPVDHEEAVRKAARDAGLSIRKVSE